MLLLHSARMSSEYSSAMSAVNKNSSLCLRVILSFTLLALRLFIWRLFEFICRCFSVLPFM